MWLALIEIAYAGSPGPAATVPDLLKCGELEACVNAVMGKVSIIAAIILVGVVAYSGFMMIWSRGNPAEFKKAREAIGYAALGFVFVLLASSIAPIIRDLFSGTP